MPCYSQAATPPSHKSRPAQLALGGSDGLWPALATVDSQRSDRGERCTLTSRGSAGIYRDAPGVALHNPSPTGSSRQVREGRPGPGPRLPGAEGPGRAGPGRYAPTPRASPWRPRQPPRTPFSGPRTPSTAPRWPPPLPEGDSRRAAAEAGPSSSSSSTPEKAGWASYRAAGHGEARRGTASSANPRGSQPGPAGGSAWAAEASRLAAPPPPLPPSHNHNNMAAGATQSALPTPSRAASGGARARWGPQLAVGGREGGPSRVWRGRGPGYWPRLASGRGCRL